MFKPIKVMDIELNRSLEDIEGLDGYAALRALVRMQGSPIGYVGVPLIGACCKTEELGNAILRQLSFNIIRGVNRKKKFNTELNFLPYEPGATCKCNVWSTGVLLLFPAFGEEIQATCSADDRWLQ